jgi:hypothetical protein
MEKVRNINHDLFKPDELFVEVKKWMLTKKYYFSYLTESLPEYNLSFRDTLNTSVENQIDENREDTLSEKTGFLSYKTIISSEILYYIINPKIESFLNESHIILKRVLKITNYSKVVEGDKYGNKLALKIVKS